MGAVVKHLTQAAAALCLVPPPTHPKQLRATQGRLRRDAEIRPRGLNPLLFDMGQSRLYLHDLYIEVSVN